MATDQLIMNNEHEQHNHIKIDRGSGKKLCMNEQAKHDWKNGIEDYFIEFLMIVMWVVWLLQITE